MARRFLLGLALSILAHLALVAGCGSPGYTSAMRTVFPADWPLDATCVKVWRTNMDTELPKFYRDGWRLIYVSEYTSTGKAGHAAVLCFERPAARR